MANQKIDEVNQEMSQTQSQQSLSHHDAIQEDGEVRKVNNLQIASSFPQILIIIYNNCIFYSISYCNKNVLCLRSWCYYFREFFISFKLDCM